MNKKVIAFLLTTVTLASAHLAEAQKPAKVPKVGYLAVAGGPSPQYDAFREGLHDLGYVEGQNIAVEYRSGEISRLADLATELVQLKVDVIVAEFAATAPAKTAAGVVPIVFGVSGDPVEAGFVASLARPGGNMTGVTFLAFELVGKRLELLKEVLPKVSRVAVLANPAHPGEQRELRETQNTAQSLGITLQYLQVKVANDFDSAFDAISRQHANALLVFPDVVTLAHGVRIAEFASKSRLPSMFGWKEYVEAGGFMSYGPNLQDLYRQRIPRYVDKILKGSKPADLPVEQPIKFEFVINLKTAKQIGLTIPQSVLYRADKVIK
ncbi:MAG TPA: ABC transporter substrate-binding protein [Candidatus Binatia bacterium]|jgi:putative ABC transport system substrate-binding protein|nr:ABC transporter substrate-binding protein [Candidatus Binatia bacterium]